MTHHAFLLPVYSQPKLLGRILNVLSSDNHHFFIHVDAKTSDYNSFIKETKDIKNVHFILPRINVYHGTISQVYAIKALLSAALENKVKIDFFHLISGQDYPLRSNEQFDNFFENTDKSFMYFDSGEFLASMQNEYQRCVNEFHFNNTHSIVSRIYERLRVGKFLKPFYKRPLIPGLYGGWDWFSWNKQTANFVNQTLNNDPDYLERFNHTASPTEHIFSTLLHPRLQELGIEDQNPLRYVSWHPHREIQTTYRPYNLNELDYESVINSTCFFCRKVDEKESARLLNMIDAQRGADFNPYREPIFT